MSYKLKNTDEPQIQVSNDKNNKEEYDWEYDWELESDAEELETKLEITQKTPPPSYESVFMEEEQAKALKPQG